MFSDFKKKKTLARLCEWKSRVPDLGGHFILRAYCTYSSLTTRITIYTSYLLQFSISFSVVRDHMLG